MNGWYITSAGEKVILESTDTIYLSNMRIIGLVIPDGAKKVYCWNNQLTNLIIPDGVKFISCGNNNLTELIVPDDCIVDCDESVTQINKTMYNRSNRLKQILK